jgi:hypothetical protein
MDNSESGDLIRGSFAGRLHWRTWRLAGEKPPDPGFPARTLPNGVALKLFALIRIRLPAANANNEW